MAASTSGATILAPWSWAPSTYWDGNDGSWNSFIVQVGTPPQDFRILPSTSGQETWVLHPQGCTQDDPVDCPYQRGTLPFQGVNSTGFRSNESSTWQDIGLYTLDAQEAQLGYGGNGLYGFDTVSLSNDSNPLSLGKQVVASIADKSYYLGEFGIGPKPINFTTFADPIPNFLATLVNQSKIPSLSFGYTAGASYRNQAPASLTLGGCDASRYTPSRLSFPMNADNSRPLQVGVQKILGQNTLNGAVNLLPAGGTYHFIDSAVSHLWLPDTAINAFVAAFGLQYDNATDLYLINDTMRSRHLQAKPTITFVLGASSQEGVATETINIDLPYAALDLQASYPYYANATNYFPIRKAVNESQMTLGRTILQETYIIADWERQDFTVGQTRFDDLSSPDLVPILSVAEAAKLNSTTSSVGATPHKHGLSAGAIAGIVVVVVAILALALVGFWFMRRRRRSQAAQQQAATSTSLADEKIHPHKDKSELPSTNVINELPPLLPKQPSEVDGNTAKWGAHGVQEAPAPPVGHEAGLQELGHGDSFRPEVPGSERPRAELEGSEVPRFF